MDEWSSLRQKAWERIFRDKEIGYLDPDIFPLLEAFRKRENAFTQSSCSGRITIIDSVFPWSRKHSSVIYKNHLGTTVDEFKEILAQNQAWRLWLVVQGPIVHVYTRDENEAWEILRIARSVGYKHSAILTENYKGTLVELRTGIKMVHLLRENQSDVINDEDLERIVRVSLDVLKEGKRKMDELRQAILSDGDDSVKLRKDSEGKPEVHDIGGKLP
ncbi:tRNA(Phe) 7-((3-amino-3-carboxypropyl)-4-demethylwyosine(37)-N(4))-methyltransferase [Sulfuracidifex tepidarius]|uniref:tRNA(Phe) 7-((3-amino-3-carboxypropyl)-4-demethylwyosine(37)-N(4))-methyltransferase n=1 Tax=Sulfuracidifex tepidarius TaxID=1294262 RepID=A0A510E406_9CREN|nr:hypothetical protein [Sulfuracidifex tepidarius]BBG24043.1 tRNA(Phe) 7-((3-amino-3-carboxypropyl)-4-demethylwyosine(37)-N(4))-methyltransferase [Sulfuracidifex tepidarius]BBG26798.1 tRNA(Phe) 7-((3-amino-3-carboxypropyl)-4-demethylwyosine(37)-N(4))-methyltransferase [Sulfuracidifex tepidarius]